MEHGRTRYRRLLSTIAVLLMACLALAGCGGSGGPEDAAGPGDVSGGDASGGDAFLSQHGLDGMDAAQIIEQLDTMPVADRPTDLIASVQPDALVLKDDQGNETQLAMPDDKVYISVAPYQQQTHDCYFHSLTTCLGELGGAEVQVALTDDATGEVLIDEPRQLFDNGFVGLWVPRNTAATLTIEYAGGSGTAAISTLSSDDPTCITTLQLT